MLLATACGGAPTNDEAASRRSLSGTWEAKQGDSSFQFSEDGKVVFSQDGLPAEGTYTLVDGDSVRIVLPSKAPFALHREADMLHLPGPPGREVIYERAE